MACFSLHFVVVFGKGVEDTVNVKAVLDGHNPFSNSIRGEKTKHSKFSVHRTGTQPYFD